MASDGDIQRLAEAMGGLDKAARELYMAQLTAVRAGRHPGQAEVQRMRTAVLDAAQHLVDVCDVPHLSETEIVMGLLSE